jgi:hypothetical protein
LTAPVRHAAARPTGTDIERWHRAVEIRREWLRHGLSTEPADRVATEHSLARIYARLHRPRPRFVWVDSPHQARHPLAGLPTLDVLYQWVHGRRPRGKPPLASDLAAGLSRLRGALDECVRDSDLNPATRARKGKDPWPVLPSLDAIRVGLPLCEVLRQGVREGLRTSLADGFYLPVRAALGPLPVCWYGQQESYWVAYYDVPRRLGLVRYAAEDNDHLDDWAALARSCGWWWPGEDVCVVVDRPSVLHTEPVPEGWHEQVRLDRRPGPAVEYRDGWRPSLT